ncbi:MAG: polysaccharide deacetylase family protein [Bacteroidales bacterium]|nr:polysaccharide deacetylase family protein [Bacteroidales bacterium]MBN2750295.1 polysaccharide deacetylase family protein [Bacteroidales bacterium]
MELLVYTNSITPRLTYIAKFLLGNILGYTVTFSTSKSKIDSFNGPVIAYTSSSVSNAVNIVPHGLLTEMDITEQPLSLSVWNGLPVVFVTSDEAKIPFDLFAASFYLVSRYEEYLPFTADSHGRFPYQESMLFKAGLLGRPLVDEWAMALRDELFTVFPKQTLPKRKFHFVPTIDIDNAFAYRHKGFRRTFFGSLRDLAYFRFSDLAARYLVILGFKHDTYDVYEQLYSLLSPYPWAVWFILGGKYGHYDKRVSLSKRPMRRLVRRISRQFEVGVHPSYGAGLSAKSVEEEVAQLSLVVNTEVSKSRQHFLRIKMPYTYRLLADLGIKADYSMGYSNTCGFRAGTCTAFPFYDLESESELPIMVVPFAVMDRALLRECGADTVKAVSHALHLAKAVRNVGGTYIILWHNESLSGINEWEGWETVLPAIMGEIKRFSLEN